MLEYKYITKTRYRKDLYVKMKRNMKTKKALLLSAFILIAILALTALTVSASVSDTAQDFIYMVYYMESETDLNTQKMYLDNADILWDMYVSEGGSPEDEGVAESYESYISQKASIEAKIALCDEFIEYVTLASEATGYPEKRENLDKADALLDKIDKNYEGVNSAYSLFSSLCNELQEPEKICEQYIEAAAKAAAGKTCSEVRSFIQEAKIIKALITIPDYTGLEEANENIKNAELFLAERALEAAPFILAVRNITSAESIPAGVMAAYKELEGIDETADGVYTALSDLEKIEADYNEMVEEANNIAKEANGFIFILIP